MRLVVGVLLILVVCIARGSNGQVPDDAWSCEEFDSEAQVTSHCVAFLQGEDVAVAREYGVTQQFLYGQLWEKQEPFNLAILDPVLGMEHRCAVSYLKHFCKFVFRSCSEGIPHLPCQSGCVSMNADCAEFFGSFGLPGFNCSSYPTMEQDPLCGSVDSSRDGHFEYDCPEPLIWYPDGDPNTGLPCAASCEYQVKISVGFDVYDPAFIYAAVMAWVSFACSMLVLVTYCVFPTTRQFPRRIVLFIAISSCCVFFIIGLNACCIPFDTVFCDGDPVVLANKGWSAFSGFLLFVSALWTGTWWAWQAFVLFWNVGLMKDPSVLQKLEPVMHITSWGYPLLIGFIGLGLEYHGGSAGFPWAFTHDSAAIWWTWVWFYGYLSVILVAVFVFIGTAMARLVRDSQLDDTFWRRWKYQIQMCIWALMYFGVVIMIVTGKAWEERLGEKVQDGVADWYACVFSGGGDDCEASYHIAKGIIWGDVFWVTFFGIGLMFVFLILNTYNRNLWRLGFLNRKEGRPFLYLPSQTTRSSGSKRSGRNTSSGDNSSSSVDGGTNDARQLRRELRADKPTI